MANPEEKKTETPPESTTPPAAATPPADKPTAARKVQPVLRTEFGLQTHQFKTFGCTLPEGTTEADLTKTELWSHIGNQLEMFHEIRAVAADGSFVADLIVVYRFGAQVKCAVKNFTVLQKIDYAAMTDMGRYELKQRGQLKWCIMDKHTGEAVRERIPTQTLALKELNAFLSTLAG